MTYLLDLGSESRNEKQSKKFIRVFHLIITASGELYRIREARVEQLVGCRVGGIWEDNGRGWGSYKLLFPSVLAALSNLQLKSSATNFNLIVPGYPARPA